ncbi:MAG: hypothetical protein ABL984_04895 [Pyrinomonadaceae bacterium]
MLYRAQLHLLIVILLSAGAIFAQTATDTKPVTKSDIFAALETAKSSDELLKKTNVDLVAAINERGVNFVLTPEEEWQLGMRDASDELLAAIREAVDPKEREARIAANQQQSLYTEFATNYNANDLAGRQTAVRAGREFVQLYADDPNVAEIVTFMQRNLPRLEQSVTMIAQREEAMERARSMAIERQQLMEQERAERDRRRQESANNPNAENVRAPRANRSDTKEEMVPPPPRQPSDPVVRTPRFPITRRP